LRRASLHDQQGEFFAVPIVNQVQGLFQRIDDKGVFVHAHLRGRLYQALMKGFV